MKNVVPIDDCLPVQTSTEGDNYVHGTKFDASGYWLGLWAMGHSRFMYRFLRMFLRSYGRSYGPIC